MLLTGFPRVPLAHLPTRLEFLPRLTAALVLEEKNRTPDGGGGWTIGWMPLGTLWAGTASAARTARSGTSPWARRGQPSA